MKKNKIIQLRHLLSAFIIATIFSSCQWVTIEPVEPEIPVEGVSFTTDIQPIFNNKCTGCHPSQGGLDLTESNSWTNIQNGRINSTTPSESLIYTKPDPNGSHSTKYSITESALVLSWIEAGALNNKK